MNITKEHIKTALLAGCIGFNVWTHFKPQPKQITTERLTVRDISFVDRNGVECAELYAFDGNGSFTIYTKNKYGETERDFSMGGGRFEMQDVNTGKMVSRIYAYEGSGKMLLASPEVMISVMLSADDAGGSLHLFDQDNQQRTYK